MRLLRLSPSGPALGGAAPLQMARDLLLGEFYVILSELFQLSVIERLKIEQDVARAFCVTRISSSSLMCMAAVSRFCVFWITNTMRKVTIVVAVLMTSCHVSL